MRKHFCTIDSKTGKSLIASEANFNHMMFYLESLLAKHNDEATECRIDPATGLYKITTVNRRTLFYDEEREYLLLD